MQEYENTRWTDYRQGLGIAGGLIRQGLGAPGGLIRQGLGGRLETPVGLIRQDWGHQ
jgi:hypothetical protein